MLLYSYMCKNNSALIVSGIANIMWNFYVMCIQLINPKIQYHEKICNLIGFIQLNVLFG